MNYILMCTTYHKWKYPGIEKKNNKSAQCNNSYQPNHGSTYVLTLWWCESDLPLVDNHISHFEFWSFPRLGMSTWSLVMLPQNYRRYSTLYCKISFMLHDFAHLRARTSVLVETRLRRALRGRTFGRLGNVGYLHFWHIFKLWWLYWDAAVWKTVEDLYISPNVAAFQPFLLRLSSKINS